MLKKEDEHIKGIQSGRTQTKFKHSKKSWKMNNTYSCLHHPILSGVDRCFKHHEHKKN